MDIGDALRVELDDPQLDALFADARAKYPSIATPPADKRAFGQAVMFRQAAAACLNPRVIDGSKKSLFIPGIVNLAFSCELAIKAMALTTGIPVRGHDLRQLFARLPARDRLAIFEKYKAICGRNAAQCVGDLDSVSAVFVVWRYTFEEIGRVRVSDGYLDWLNLALLRQGAEVVPDISLDQRMALEIDCREERALHSVAEGALMVKVRYASGASGGFETPTRRQSE